MQIWAHTLVQNEGRWLWFAVNSVINYVDKLLLWDFGSTDDSIKIARDIKKQFPEKIVFRESEGLTPQSFTAARQRMLDETRSDWFFMLDGDEIWWEDSIRTVANEIKKKSNWLESIVVPTVNVVGDIFHYQEEAAGMYKIAGRTGHMNMRAINRNIPGLHSRGEHGRWGWADGSGKMIQERDHSKIAFLDAPYIHTTFLKRSSVSFGDSVVAKRKIKKKFELGRSFPGNYYFPEVFFLPRPDYIVSPWETMNSAFRLRAIIETPLRKIKRRIWKGRAGY